jgi:hypothetical protein
MKSHSNGNIYREVNSLEDIRRINRRIRREMGGIRTREQLTELKKRSDYLCTLTRAPAWRKKFGRKSSRMLSVAKTEDTKTTKRANGIAHRRAWDVEYDPWGK